MMDHILEHDWSEPETEYFISEEDLKNSVIEKIIQNRFHDPDISSDSEDENNSTDWDAIFNKVRVGMSSRRLFVPGLRPTPPFPKLSALTEQQHKHCLAVLCSKKPKILPEEFIPRPSKEDYKVFQEVKETYLKEQEKYRKWAQALWTNGQCIRALRPNAQIELVYKAEFKMRAKHMMAYPKVFEEVAQILLDGKGQFEMVPLETMISVNTMKLAQLDYPASIKQRLTVLQACPRPEPCEMHPVRFVLPGESTPTTLPVTEVHLELAQFAAAHGVSFVAGERALCCLAERRAWTLPVSVCSVPGIGGETFNVTVLGNEFSNKPEEPTMRTFRAYRRLLENLFVPSLEITKWSTDPEQRREEAMASNDDTLRADGQHNPWMDDYKPSSDDENYRLFLEFKKMMDASDDEDCKRETAKKDNMPDESEVIMTLEGEGGTAAKQNEEQNKLDINNSMSGACGVDKCTCKNTIFEHLPPRSFQKWEFKNNTTMERHEVIVHCAHKYSGLSGEVLLEPICEYQAELGASKQQEDRLRCMALSLALRENATVVNVRISANSGDVITIEELSRAQLNQVNSPERLAAVQASIHTVLSQLQGLLPGHYVLMHEPRRSDNVVLYAPRDTGKEQKLRLRFDSALGGRSRVAPAAPVLTPALLPWHKFRKTLPCAFTYHLNELAKGPMKQRAKQRMQSQAAKCPKNKKGGKNKRK